MDVRTVKLLQRSRDCYRECISAGFEALWLERVESPPVALLVITRQSLFLISTACLHKRGNNPAVFLMGKNMYVYKTINTGRKLVCLLLSLLVFSLWARHFFLRRSIWESAIRNGVPKEGQYYMVILGTCWLLWHIYEHYLPTSTLHPKVTESRTKGTKV